MIKARLAADHQKGLAHNGAIYVGIGQLDPARLEQIFQQEMRTQFLRRHAPIVLPVRCGDEFHFILP